MKFYHGNCFVTTFFLISWQSRFEIFIKKILVFTLFNNSFFACKNIFLIILQKLFREFINLVMKGFCYFFLFFIMLLFSAGVDWAVDYLMNIVKGEEKHGIQADRVMIGGFSQVFMQI